MYIHETQLEVAFSVAPFTQVKYIYSQTTVLVIMNNYRENMDAQRSEFDRLLFKPINRHLLEKGEIPTCVRPLSWLWRGLLQKRVLRILVSLLVHINVMPQYSRMIKRICL